MNLLTLPRLADLPAAHWDGLLVDDMPFLRHAFLSSLEESGSVGGRSGWYPAHRLLCGADGLPQAALPAYVKTHSRGEYVFDHAWAEACQRAGIAYYPKLLGAVPFSPVSGARLLARSEAAAETLLEALEPHLVEEGLSGLHLNFTDGFADDLLARRSSWLMRLGCQFHWFDRGYRDFQDFLDALASRKRKQMRKEREQVAGQGIDFDWREGHQLSEAEWDFVYVCYANTYRVRGQLPYLSREFFSLLAERMPASIRVVLARQQGRPVAMALFLVGAGVLYGRYWGCLGDFDRLHFETCLYQGLELALALGVTRFDAGAQGEHKLVRGFEPVMTRSWHHLRHSGLHRAVAQFLEEERVAVEAYAAQARSALPFRQA